MGNFSVSKKSLEFVKNRFREYYEDNKVEMPDRFSRREYAFVYFFGKGMMRHISFNRKKNLFSFLEEKNPAHVYYSTAYYQEPEAARMQDKKWMGAELIFDLDSDHLPEAEKYTYSEQLKKVKKEFKKLVNDFLINDFGFDKKYLDLYFSGSRGYHCHVKDPDILSLNSGERREIVDYITGRDLKESIIFKEEVTGSKKYGRKRYPTGKTLKMPTPEEPGWKGRISRGIIEIIEEIIDSENPKERLEKYGVTEKNAEKLLKDLSKNRIKRIKEGHLDQSKMIRKFFLNKALRKKAVSIASGETDEPVTCDVKRLIRLPGSLHGKTGFKVTKINLDELESFEPLEDAVILSDKLVKAELKEPYSIKIKDEYFDLEEGKQKIPTFLATFLIGRKKANIM